MNAPGTDGADPELHAAQKLGAGLLHQAAYGTPVTRFTGEHAALSNFAPTPFTLRDIPWPTSEHAFQAFKSQDPNIWQRIASRPSPAWAKQSGRQLHLRPDWEQVKKRIMLGVLMAKFTQNPAALAVLAGTGDRRLVEGNTWHDQIWGDCECGKPACQLPGLNYLGNLLMAVRFVLREDG